MRGIEREKRKEELDFLEACLAFNLEDLKMAKNIDEKEKKRLFKSIVHPNEDLLVDNQLGIDDWNLPDNNADTPFKLPTDMKFLVDDIIKNLLLIQKVMICLG